MCASEVRPLLGTSAYQVGRNSLGWASVPDSQPRTGRSPTDDFTPSPLRPRPLDRPDVRLCRGRLGGRCDGEDPARRPAAPDEGGAHRGGPQRVRGIPGGGDRSGERSVRLARRASRGRASSRTSSSTASTRSTCRRRPRSTARPAAGPTRSCPTSTMSSARSATRSRSTSQPASRAIWVEVRVPPDAKPGSFFGNVTVTTDAGEAQIPVALTVWDFELPSTSS